MQSDFILLTTFVLSCSASASRVDIDETIFEFSSKHLKDSVGDHIYSEKDDYLPEESMEIMETLNEIVTIETNDRISGGEVVIPNTIPYQAGIGIEKEDKSSWCGGCIISNDFILTAAHCLDKAVSARLMLGAHDRSIKHEKGRINLKVSKTSFILHENFDRNTLANDIALIRLNLPISFTAEIQPIALPWNLNSTFEGYDVSFSGWGRYDSQEKHSRYLRQAQSKIAENSVCAKDYKRFIAKTNICLDGSEGQGTCKGDSGGPLVARTTNNTLILIGVNSFGTSKGCDKRKNNVFTRLTAFLPWTQDKTGIKTE